MRSFSGRTGSPAALVFAPFIVAVLTALAVPAAATVRLDTVRGHIAFGFGHLFADRAPGGSLSIAGGLDVPVASSLRAGLDVGYDLLGTRTEERGTLVGELDYSLFEALALLHWTPSWPGPLGRISIGPGVFNARADLASSGGAAFSDLAVGQTVAGGAVALTLMSRKPSPVRVGFELGARVLFLDRPRFIPQVDNNGEPVFYPKSWTVASGRIVFHY